MPLVSGVCRKASAPKLSHGGSRLNASKPEANPKTRCPTTKTWFYTSFTMESMQPTRLIPPICCATQKHIYRIAIQRNAGSARLEGAKYIHDHKNLQTNSTVKTKVYRYSKRLDAELRDGNKLFQLTSLSKRENMHGLA